MAAKDIKDEKSLERWLKVRPIEDARVIAARAALRVVPALEAYGRRLGDAVWAPPLVLAEFSQHAVARAAGRFPAGATVLSVAAAGIARFAKDAYISRRIRVHLAQAYAEGSYDTAQAANFTTTANAADCASTAASNAAAAATATTAAAADANRASTASAKAANAFADATVFWASMREDAEALESGVAPSALASTPLWAKTTPKWAAQNWDTLKGQLLARPAEYWDVWTDWYEARLRGEPGNEGEEIARILEVTEGEWKAGPAVANKKIKDIVARFRAQPATTTNAVASIATATAVETPTTASLFISHASQADGARAQALVAALEATGQRCWIAPRDITAGADWNDSILTAIEACGGVVLLVSPASVASPFVKAEIQHAFEHKKRVVPVRLADAQPSLLDLRLKTVQHIEADTDFSLVVRAIISL
jgi:hypothetical protein